MYTNSSDSDAMKSSKYPEQEKHAVTSFNVLPRLCGNSMMTMVAMVAMMTMMTMMAMMTIMRNKS